MKQQEAQKEIEKLRAEIQRHDYLYYVEAKPVISDQEYDRLMSELKAIENDFPELITADSPTQRVSGQPLKEFKTVTHRVPMLSLENTYSAEEIREFDKRVRKGLDNKQPEYAVEPKIDGVAVSLVYREGVFSLGATRGDGAKGDNITANLKTIKSVPLKIMPSQEFRLRFGSDGLEVRGEVYLPRRDFLRINQEREENDESLFANPRNAAAGSLKLLDSREVARRPLDIFIHTTVEPEKAKWKTHSRALKDLQKFGFKVVEFFKVCKGIDEVIEFCNSWEEKRDSLAFEIDGMVIKVNSFAQQEILGATGKNPRWAIAYKYPARQAQTRLEDVILQVGRTGTITPVAVLKPVPLSGSVISRCTLHNFDEVKRKDIRIGDTVIIEKGGEVIPKIVRVEVSKRTGSEKKFSIPSNCPVCGSRLIHLADEVAFRCPNVACASQIQRRIEHFTMRTAMNLENFGPAIIEQLISKGLAGDYADLYFLKKEKLVELERMGEKSSQNLMDALEQSKNNSLPMLIFGLGIRHVGIHIAEILAEHYSTLDVLISAGRQDLEKISGIGPVVAESIAAFFAEQQNMKVIGKLRKAGVNFAGRSEYTPASRKLSGKTFVFTGELNGYSRDEAAVLVKKSGGRVASSVSSKTDFVVSGREPGSKYDRAKSLGVKIIDEAEFRRMAGK